MGLFIAWNRISPLASFPLLAKRTQFRSVKELGRASHFGGGVPNEDLPTGNFWRLKVETRAYPIDSVLIGPLVLRSHILPLNVQLLDSTVSLRNQAPLPKHCFIPVLPDSKSQAI